MLYRRTGGHSADTGLAYLSLSVADENGNALASARSGGAPRTARPNLAAGGFASFALDGSSDGGFEWTRLWASSSPAGALSELLSASVGVPAGRWQFRLAAKKGGAEYEGTAPRREILAGQANALFFTLSLARLAADEANSSGGVKVALAFPASGVSRVTAEVKSLDGAVVCAEEAAAVTGSGAAKTAAYEKSGLAAGTYAVDFHFYAADANTGADILIGSCREYAGIASGVTSVSDCIAIESLDQTYSIAYDYNSGSLASGQTAQGSYSRHSSVTLPTAAQLTRTGYTFAGWYDNASFMGTAATQIPADSTGNKSFWAKWEANTYTVRFHKNTVTNDTATKSQTFTYDKSQSLQTLSALGWSHAAATFIGWAKSATATAKAYSDGQDGALNLTTTPNDTVDLYAVWQYAITYYGNKGSSHATDVTGSTASQTVTGYATSITLQSNRFSHTGYTFNGWNTNTGGTGTNYAASAAYTFTANTALYAKWTRDSYTITFTENSGSWASGYTKPATYTVESSAVTLPTASNINRTGYTFAGWYESSAFSGSAVTQIAAKSAGNKTYYAKWTANTYTVTLDANGGSGGTASVTATYDSAMPAITAPTRAGYTFAGYYDTSATTGGNQYYAKDKSSATSYTTAGNKTLYARWTRITCTVTIKTGWAKGATTTTTKTATWGEAMPALTTTNPPSSHGSIGAFTRVGYDLQGFYTEENGGGTKYYNADGTSAKTSDLETATTLYAYWKAKGTVLTGSASGGSLSGTRVVSSDVSYTNSNGPGFTVNGTLNLYIEEGCTLTAKGSDGNTGKGGYAGINLPSGNTLNLYGYGSVVATGGKGGDAEAGKSNAKDAHAKKSGNSFQGINGGTGGAGGKGAGGGGAGIGGKGGDGGSGGSGGTGYSANDLSYKYFWAGNDGGAGSSGSAGTSCGTIKKEANITITATAGAGGSNGSGGACNTETTSITSNGEATNYRLEIAMNNKWTCGAGGAGGGGGGTISCEDSYIYQGGEGGKGGSGSSAGGDGNDDGPYDRYNFKKSDKKTSNETGHGGSGGAAGGGAGTSASVGSL